MNNKRKWTAAALLIRRSSGRPGLYGLAIGGRPGKGQHVKIEFAGLALATILGKSDNGKNEGETESDRGNVRQLAQAMSTHDALSPN
jgi:hypothetical protein